MKRISIIHVFALFLSIVFVSCKKLDQNPLTGKGKEGGFIQADPAFPPSTKLVNYYYGAVAPTKAIVKINQGNQIITRMDVYKTFYTADTTFTHDTLGLEVLKTNRVLLKSYTISDSLPHFYTLSFTYLDLAKDLILGGAAFPASDLSLSIGSYWVLEYVGVTSGGEALSSNNTTVSVASRFAGTYKVSNQEYFRIGVPRPDVGWPETYDIQSVNSSTYKVVGYAGPFAGSAPGVNDVLFQVNNITGHITYLPGQILNSQPIITCDTDPGLLTNVHCGSSNTGVIDLVTNKDRLTMSCGYLSPSGPREWYVELVKIP